jgi:hypothetical protein
MKILLTTISLMFLTMTTFAKGKDMTLEKEYKLNCKGVTNAGDLYKLNTIYSMNPRLLKTERPYNLSLDERAFIQVVVTRNDQIIFDDAVYSNNLQLISNEDGSMTYQFSRLELAKSGPLEATIYSSVQTDFANITMMADGTSHFDFEVTSSWGNFNSGTCILN